MSLSSNHTEYDEAQDFVENTLTRPRATSVKRHKRTSTAGSDVSFTSSLPVHESAFSDTPETGCIYEYYKGEFTSLPEFNALPEPDGRGIVNLISINATSEFVQFDPTLQADRMKESGNYAVRFTAQLKIPHTGLWSFFLTSNDGSALYISGKKVIQNDGSHYATEKEGRLRIRSPGYYPITILYFHKNGKLLEGVRTGAFLSFSYHFAGSGWLPYPPDYVAKQIVPASSLFYDPNDERVYRILTAIAANQGSQDTIHNEYSDMDLTMALEQEIRDLSSKVLILQRSIQSFHDRFETLFYKIRQQPLSGQDVNESIKLARHEDSDLGFEEAFTAKMSFVENYLAETQKLQCQYFFMLGLGLKMDLQQNNFVLRDAYEKILEECVPVMEWPTYLKQLMLQGSNDHVKQ